jgi:hypothetical protein
VARTLTRRGNRDGSIEQRFRCLAFEEADNPFDEVGVPSRKGDEVRNNFDVMAWFGDLVQERVSSPDESANHIPVPTQRTDILDGHAWYDEGLHYAYSVPENATDLLGKTVSGVIELRSWGLACKPGECDPSIGVHHHAIKIEIGDKDYWVEQHFSAPSDPPIPQSGDALVTFLLDTMQLSNGWHILSYHMHKIDKRDLAGLNGKQLATEVKIPILVSNP